MTIYKIALLKPEALDLLIALEKLDLIDMVERTEAPELDDKSIDWRLEKKTEAWGDKITMDEINEEIRLAREERKEKECQKKKKSKSSSTPISTSAH